MSGGVGVVSGREMSGSEGRSNEWGEGGGNCVAMWVLYGFK